MLSFISPLDKSYISLRRAAALIASEMPGAEPDEIMEMFKYAIFSREFEREEIAVNGRETCEAISLPILRIESPPPFNAPVRLSPEQQPHDLFAVKAMTVAEVLSERDGLPGEGKRGRHLQIHPPISRQKSALWMRWHASLTQRFRPRERVFSTA